MGKEKKAPVIDSLEQTFAKSIVAILTEYRGIPNSELTTIRRKLRDSGSEFRVVKNTLARIAAKKAGKENIINSLEGPTAIAFGYKDITAPAKVLSSYIVSTQTNLKIKGGFLNDRMITSADVTILATLPSREVLISRVMGQMKAPVSNLLGVLNSPIRGFMGVLQARMKQLEAK